MTFKKLQELLDAGKISTEVANELDGEISTAMGNLRNEAKSWREKYQEVSGSLESVMNTKNDLETRLKDIDAQIQKAKEEGKAELVKQLEATKQEQEELKTNLEKIESENKKLKIENAVTEKLQGLNPVDLEAVKTLITLNAELGEDGVKIKVGDTAYSLDEGLEKFKEAKPSLFGAVGKGGTQTPPNIKGGEGFKRSTMTPEQKTQFIAANGSDAYLALPL